MRQKSMPRNTSGEAFFPPRTTESVYALRRRHFLSDLPSLPMDWNPFGRSSTNMGGVRRPFYRLVDYVQRLLTLDRGNPTLSTVKSVLRAYPLNQVPNEKRRGSKRRLTYGSQQSVEASPRNSHPSII